MYTRLCSLFLCVLVLSSCCTTGTRPRKAAMSNDVLSDQPVALTSNQALMKEVVDDPRFPSELVGLTVLTMGLTLSDLFSDTGGVDISTVIAKFETNMQDFAKLGGIYTRVLVAEDILTILDELKKDPNVSAYGTKPWRTLLTNDLTNVYDGNGNRAPDPRTVLLFQKLGELRAHNCQMPALMLAQKYPNPRMTDGVRVPVSDALSTMYGGRTFLQHFGYLTYYDLFSTAKDGKSDAQLDAMDAVLEAGLLRGKGRTFGNDCCCKTASPDGFKKCYDSPDLGCTNTGSPTRCTLGSYSCPTGTACP